MLAENYRAPENNLEVRVDFGTQHDSDVSVCGIERLSPQSESFAEHKRLTFHDVTLMYSFILV